MAGLHVPYALRGALLLGLALSGATPARGHVQLDLPNGGEVLGVGSVYTVTWHIVIAHNLQDWDLWYSTDSGATWTSIATDLPPGDPSAGSVHTFDWTVPNTPTTQGRVRVRMDNSGTDYFDESNANLTIEQAVAIVSSSPPDGGIDARQPTEVDGTGDYGWSEVELTFDGAVTRLTPKDFTVTLDPPGTPPYLAWVFTEGNVALLQFGEFAAEPIPPGHWTIITHNDSQSSVRIGYLPADVNGDRTAAPLDILALIDFLNGVGDALEIWQSDPDRSGEANPADILRVVDLLNGAGKFDPWNQETLPE